MSPIEIRLHRKIIFVSANSIIISGLLIQSIGIAVPYIIPKAKYRVHVVKLDPNTYMKAVDFLWSLPPDSNVGNRGAVYLYVFRSTRLLHTFGLRRLTIDGAMIAHT